MKYSTNGGVIVTSAQRAAARAIVKRAYAKGRDYPSEAVFAIANAISVTRESNTVSNANLVNARELEITAVTTVSELFDMIDLPYRITKHAKVSIKAVQGPVSFEPTRLLRIEWRGEGV